MALYAVKALAASPSTTRGMASITGCHTHGANIFCHDEYGHEDLLLATVTPISTVHAQYIGRHSQVSERYWEDSAGNEVLVQKEGTEHGPMSERDESKHNHSSYGKRERGETPETHCHFHAGVEHCVGEDEPEESSQQLCGTQSREYNVPLRIGTLFVVLVTSYIGVFAPILLANLPSKGINRFVSTIIRQFGTGVIIATAYVHLYTHATLTFTNECLGELDYEATTSAIVMAGVFLAFLFEYAGFRIIVAREDIASASDRGAYRKNAGSSVAQPQTMLAHCGNSRGLSSAPTQPTTKFSVLFMESGILFHSILIGLTLVVAGDSFYKSLLVVIVFHQFFEGLALGARIATLPGAIFPFKALIASAFGLITPIGMAIGLGVLHSFNGNEKGTLVALGTLDALSAGILIWVGIVDMWARDWVIEGGEMLNVDWGDAITGFLSLMTGLILMSLLGKWT